MKRIHLISTDGGSPCGDIWVEKWNTDETDSPDFHGWGTKSTRLGVCHVRSRMFVATSTNFTHRFSPHLYKEGG